MSCMFSDCSSLTSLDLFNFNINNDMIEMYSHCSSLTSLDLFNFNTNNVKNMREMFSHCSSLNFFKNQRQKILKEWKNNSF